MKRAVLVLGIAGLALAGCQPVDPIAECARYDTEIARVRASGPWMDPSMDIFEQSKWLKENTTPEQSAQYDEIDRKFGKRLDTSDPLYFCMQLRN